MEAVFALLDHAVRVSDGLLLRQIHQCALDEKSTLSSASNEVLLRGYSALGDSRAVEVFDDMIQTGCEQIESAITTVVSLCAESRYVQMAEHAVGHIRESNGHATLALYSALMYSHGRMYHKICDLYESMKWDGVEVDTVIYGSSHVSQHSCRNGAEYGPSQRCVIVYRTA